MACARWVPSLIRLEFFNFPQLNLNHVIIMIGFVGKRRTKQIINQWRTEWSVMSESSVIFRQTRKKNEKRNREDKKSAGQIYIGIGYKTNKNNKAMISACSSSAGRIDRAFHLNHSP